MRHFFITLYLLGISLFSSAQQEEKAALLITHYGSSDPQTRALTLDVVTREAQEAFPQFTVREAYISPIVRKRLAKEGYFVMYPFSCSNIISRFGFETEKGTADLRDFLTRNRMVVRLKIWILPVRFSVQRPVLRSLG